MHGALGSQSLPPLAVVTPIEPLPFGRLMPRKIHALVAPTCTQSMYH